VLQNKPGGRWLLVWVRLPQDTSKEDHSFVEAVFGNLLFKHDPTRLKTAPWTPDRKEQSRVLKKLGRRLHSYHKSWDAHALSLCAFLAKGNDQKQLTKNGARRHKKIGFDGTVISTGANIRKWPPWFAANKKWCFQISWWSFWPKWNTRLDQLYILFISRS